MTTSPSSRSRCPTCRRRTSSRAGDRVVAARTRRIASIGAGRLLRASRSRAIDGTRASPSRPTAPAAALERARLAERRDRRAPRRTGRRPGPSRAPRTGRPHHRPRGARQPRPGPPGRATSRAAAARSRTAGSVEPVVARTSPASRRRAASSPAAASPASADILTIGRGVLGEARPARRSAPARTSSRRGRGRAASYARPGSTSSDRAADLVLGDGIQVRDRDEERPASQRVDERRPVGAVQEDRRSTSRPRRRSS